MLDGRTREGYERQVLQQVMAHGGFSIFWVTENQKRAHAAERLVKEGRIVRTGGSYPWMEFSFTRVVK